jgi:hypothetical protein
VAGARHRKARRAWSDGSPPDITATIVAPVSFTGTDSSRFPPLPTSGLPCPDKLQSVCVLRLSALETCATRAHRPNHPGCGPRTRTG